MSEKRMDKIWNKLYQYNLRKEDEEWRKGNLEPEIKKYSFNKIQNSTVLIISLVLFCIFLYFCIEADYSMNEESLIVYIFECVVSYGIVFGIISALTYIISIPFFIILEESMPEHITFKYIRKHRMIYADRFEFYEDNFKEIHDIELGLFEIEKDLRDLGLLNELQRKHTKTSLLTNKDFIELIEIYTDKIERAMSEIDSIDENASLNLQNKNKDMAYKILQKHKTINNLD